MSVSLYDELELIAHEIRIFLSTYTLQYLARDVRFVQQNSKYQAKGLVNLCVWVGQNIAITSLAQLSSYLEASTKVLISPEGLNQQLNKGNVLLLQYLLFEKDRLIDICFCKLDSDWIPSAFWRKLTLRKNKMNRPYGQLIYMIFAIGSYCKIILFWVRSIFVLFF